MDKVKLRKEIASLLQVIRDDGFSDYALIGMLYLNDKNYEPIHRLSGFMGQGSGKMHPDVLLKALVDGYEVEETPEDKVKSYYEFCTERIATTQDASEYKTFTGERYGIRNTLILLNIKIEGIN